MEKYVYYSIFIFSAFVFFLYVYLMIQKLRGIINERRRSAYTNGIWEIVDKVVSLIEVQYPGRAEIERMREMVNDRIKREIIEDRIIHYIEVFSGVIRKRLVKLSADIGLVDYCIRDLTSKDIFKVALTCKKLGEFRNRKAIPHIAALLDKNILDIKYNGLMAISKIGDLDELKAGIDMVGNNIVLSERSLIEIIDSFEGDKKALYNMMVNSNNVYISTIFIKSAGNYMDISLNNEVSRFIGDEHTDRCIAAIKAIGQSGDARYFYNIADCLSDSKWEVRAAAAKAMGRLGDPRALDYLANALRDREWWVRYNSAFSIINLPGGMNTVQNVINGEDKFAKDILISTIENSNIMDNIELYENSMDTEKKEFARIIKGYVPSK